MRAKLKLLAFLLVVNLSAFSQKDTLLFSLNPISMYGIDSIDKRKILKSLNLFLGDLRTGFSPIVVGPDFISKSPYQFDFFRMYYKTGNYKTQLLRSSRVGDSSFILKLALINKNCTLNDIGIIINIVTEIIDDSCSFTSYLDHNVNKLVYTKLGNIEYFCSTPIDRDKGVLMDSANTFLAKEFEAKPKRVKYYKFENSIRLFEALGYEFIPNMYFDTVGGWSNPNSNSILSGNNSELYIHELVHLYLADLCPSGINHFATEGIATLYGGSGNISYESGIMFLAKTVLQAREKPDLLSYFINDVQIEHKYSSKYFIGSLISQKVKEKYGLSGLKQLLCSKKLEGFLKTTDSLIGLNEENFNIRIPEYLNEELKRLSQ